ncbi:MAG: RnfH family protein [Pseudomonadota bacterium]|jgi:putative ubiquitin-RnfH superfamily antitoxin RatB of RatAB toxin-antitoxin module
MIVPRAEVCYAGPEGQFLLQVELPAGATLRDAIDASGILARVPALVVDDRHVGVFSKPRSLSSPVAEGDRVEIYRPLKTDPREARRARAAKPRV